MNKEVTNKEIDDALIESLKKWSNKMDVQLSKRQQLIILQNAIQKIFPDMQDEK